MTPITFEPLKVYEQGRLVHLRAVAVAGTRVTLHRSLLRTAKIHDEWFSEVTAPEDILRFLRATRLADIFTFWQMLPHTTPQFDYPMEYAAISALPIHSHEHWMSRQITKEVRKNIKKAARRGIEIRRVTFDDALILGMTQIFNESPIRQGKAFWHYGKGADDVKVEMGQDLDRSHFIGAFFENELVGFYKLISGKSFAQPVMSISMIKHRDKYTDTALISDAVQFCCDHGLQYLTYGDWRRDSHRDFLESHGFTKIDLPRYYVPLSRLGRVALRLGLHKGAKEFAKAHMPERTLRAALKMREKFYRRRFGGDAATATPSHEDTT